MAHCRKCGSGKITRRRAGEFFCQHCGMQPGLLKMDRFGTPTATPESETPDEDAQ